MFVLSFWEEQFVLQPCESEQWGAAACSFPLPVSLVHVFFQYCSLNRTGMFGELEGQKFPEMVQGSKNLSFLVCKFKDFVFYVLKSQLQDSPRRPDNGLQIKDFWQWLALENEIWAPRRKWWKRGRRNIGKVQVKNEELHSFIHSFIIESFGVDQARLLVVLLCVE